MNSKYLPIGTICEIDSCLKKVMIISFKERQYNGDFVEYDYVGCEYPEGMLLKNKLVNFNHDNIKRIVYSGYLSQEHNSLNTILNGTFTEETPKIEEVKQKRRFKFNENGIVIFDSMEQLVVPEDEQPKQQPQKKYTFDANGYVINVENEQKDNPFTQQQNTTEIAKPNTHNNIFKASNESTNEIL